MSKDSNGYNPSILDTHHNQCFMCGREGDFGGFARHEIFYGPWRKVSKEQGTWCYLCPPCHQHAPWAIHRNHEKDLELKRIAQRKYEELYGHEKFMEIFGRNYL